MDEKMHWRDHHCMDTGLDYDMKHADLEKSFGVKFPGSGLKFWSSVIKGTKKRKFKRGNGCDNSAAGVNAKRRILERSASTAICDNNADISVDASSGEECLPADNYNGEPDENSGIQPLPRKRHLLSHMYDFSLIRDPFLRTLDRLIEAAKVGENFPSSTNVVGDAKTNGVNGEDSSVDVVNRNMDANTSEINNYTSEKLYSEPAMDHSVSKTESGLGPKVEDIVAELVDGVDVVPSEGIEKMLPVSLDSVHFKGGTLMLLAYGDREPR
ncbi:hypothetical protein GH714_035325 [Hevea brasiliensis]|uniref:Uncharacterized protein n=1 Tax=Hevea brasiliensis TaxID=3981 RepID=A0A6A6KF32_HEVBR|nr:hypothetical protein GH714_035325 [Hevea brasiliensis]